MNNRKPTILFKDDAKLIRNVARSSFFIAFRNSQGREVPPGVIRQSR
jgi:hypothetical protein